MRPHYWSLGKLLQQRVFEIPEYQRTYSWTERQRDDLFGDIERLLRPEEAGRSHFMATIACLAPPATDGAEKADEFDRTDEDGASRLDVTVVDGQQRLTSLVILLKAIEKKLRQLAREAPSETNEGLFVGSCGQDWGRAKGDRRPDALWKASGAEPLRHPTELGRRFAYSTGSPVGAAASGLRLRSEEGVLTPGRRRRCFRTNFSVLRSA